MQFAEMVSAAPVAGEHSDVKPLGPRLQDMNDANDDVPIVPAPDPEIQLADAPRYAPTADHSTKTNVHALACSRVWSDEQKIRELRSSTDPRLEPA